EVQRVWMIGRLPDPHGGLRASDGVVELSELREHEGKVRSRKRRLDGGRSEAFIAKIPVERSVPFEKDGRLAELAAGRVRQAKKGRGEHLEGSIAEALRDAQGLRPESQRLGVVADVQ